MYIKNGSGIEIGALHNPMTLPPSARVTYVDRISTEELRRMYPEVPQEKIVAVGVVDDGETLARFGDGTQDFVVANHFLEHCQNPVGTVIAIDRVLKRGGVAFLSVPDKRYTFDRDREVTTLAHLFDDHLQGPQSSRSAHYEEYIRAMNKGAEESDIMQMTKQLEDDGYPIHFHVWAQTDMLDLVSALQKVLGFHVECMLRMGIEVVFVLRKQ